MVEEANYAFFLNTRIFQADCVGLWWDIGG
jgi:hypothetical protein